MRFFIGFVSGILFVVLVAYAFIASGGMPVATKGGPLPFEKFIVRTSLHAALKEPSKIPAPFAADRNHLLAGAQTYRNHCAGCHGMMNQEVSRFSLAMFPHPPFLLPPHEGVTDDPVGETFWKTKNGIRLTGMPGFVEILNDQEIWEVSLLLASANQLPTDVQAALSTTK